MNGSSVPKVATVLVAGALVLAGFAAGFFLAGSQLEVVEVEKPVHVVPEACLEALDAAEQGFLEVAHVFDLVGESYQALAEFDLVEFERIADELLLASDSLGLEAGGFGNPAAACRGAA